MNLKTARWVWAVLGLQVVFLLAWAGYHEIVRTYAPTIRLKTTPVDPRDVLRGDYMILGYEISQPGMAVKPSGFEGGTVYVVLKPQGTHHVVEEVLSIEPAPDDTRPWVEAVAWGEGEALRITYGIEQFYVPEGRGTPQFKTLEVEASVSATHKLYIRRLWLDGKRFP